MSITGKHAEVTATWHGLPNTKNVASYNYVDQVVLFETIEAEHIASCLSKSSLPEQWPLRKDVWLNGWHEYTHWLDMTSSVFGLRWLCKLVGLLKQYPGDDEPAYSDECKAATREMAGIHLPEYYSTVENQAGRPWVYSSTVGRAYDYQGNLNPDHPLWFVRFATLSGLPIARQPISVASLLEVRAVDAEMLGGFGLISALPDKAFRLIEQRHLSEDIMSRLYEPNLTVYSAAAHWYANHRGLTDVVEAYRAASVLAWFCLDAPTDWIASLKTTANFKNRMGEEFGNLMNKSLSRVDRGALFFMLASDERLRSIKSLKTDLHALVKQEWDADLSAVQKASRKERDELADQLVSTAGPVKTLAAIWKKNLGERSLEGPLTPGARNVRLPAVILADDTPLNIFRMRLGDKAFDDRVFDPRPYFDEFFNAHLAMKKRGSYSEHGLQCFSI